MRTITVSFLMLLLVAAPASAQHASADSAWRAGDVARAERVYAQLLAADSSDDTALHRMALLLAWRDQHDRSIALFDRLLRVSPDNTDARVDRARVLAWRGDTRGAVAALDSVLAVQPQHASALQARAQFLSWAGEYDAALRAYDRLLDISPELQSLRTDRARVLLWAERFDAAAAVYDSLLTRNPDDLDARLGLAQVLTASSQLDSAAAIYASILARHPDNLTAMQGRARALTYGGHLVAGEQAWREALAADASDVTSRVGLAQALRWQGRDAAAYELLADAPGGGMGQREIQEQLIWIRRNLAPRVAPSAVFEDDSDDNRVSTIAASAAYRVALRSELRADAYLRSAEDPTSGMQAWGGTINWWQHLEPGWSVTAGLGVSASDAADAKGFTAVRAGVTSPGRYPLGFGMSVVRSALDATAALIRREVRSDEINADVRWAAGGWNAGGGAGFMRLESRVSGAENERWSVAGTVTRRVARPLVLGVRARAYGYAENTADGYFDPEQYLLGEVTARWLRENSRWSMNVEAAPGVQRIQLHDAEANTSGSYRLNARLARVLSPGRTIGITAAAANSGVQQLSPGAAGDYRYYAIGLAANWTF